MIVLPRLYHHQFLKYLPENIRVVQTYHCLRQSAEIIRVRNVTNGKGTRCTLQLIQSTSMIDSLQQYPTQQIKRCTDVQMYPSIVTVHAVCAFLSGISAVGAFLPGLSAVGAFLRITAGRL